MGMKEDFLAWVGDHPIHKAIIVVLLLVVVYLYRRGCDTMASTPSSKIGSVGTSNVVSGGNSPMWAHGSQAAGGHLSQDTGSTGATHWLHQGPASAAVSSSPWNPKNAVGMSDRASGVAASALMDVGDGPTLAQVMASCSGPSPDAVEDMKMAHMVGSVDPAKV